MPGMKASPVMPVSSTDAAYIAGFFDGEGTINVLRTARNGRFFVEATAVQVDPRPLKFIHDRFTGSLWLNNKTRGVRKPVWVWAVTGYRFDRFIEAVFPYLINKRDKAAIAVEMRGLMMGRPHGPLPLTEPEVQHRLRLVVAAKAQSL